VGSYLQRLARAVTITSRHVEECVAVADDINIRVGDERVWMHRLDSSNSDSIGAFVDGTKSRNEDALIRSWRTPTLLVEPEEVAAMCLLLAFPAGRSITGQSLIIDNGRNLRAIGAAGPLAAVCAEQGREG
jgi:NAD(P)-dependent dehydrogenase (short-subunit alcohol dehydrogenase family)